MKGTAPFNGAEDSPPAPHREGDDVKKHTALPTRRASYRGHNRFRKVEAHRLMRGVLDAGLQVVGVEVDPGGTIRVLTSQAAANDAGAANPWDEVLGNAAHEKRTA